MSSIVNITPRNNDYAVFIHHIFHGGQFLAVTYDGQAIALGRDGEPLMSLSAHHFAPANYGRICCIKAVGSGMGSKIAMCFRLLDIAEVCRVVVIARSSFEAGLHGNARGVDIEVKCPKSLSVAFLTEDLLYLVCDRRIIRLDSRDMSRRFFPSEHTKWGQDLAAMTPEVQNYFTEVRPETAMVRLSQRHLLVGICGGLYAFSDSSYGDGRTGFSRYRLPLGDNEALPIAQIAVMSDYSVLIWDGYSTLSVVNLTTGTVKAHLQSPVGGPERRVVLCQIPRLFRGVCVSFEASNRMLVSLRRANANMSRRMDYTDRFFVRVKFLNITRDKAIARAKLVNEGPDTRRGLAGLFYDGCPSEVFRLVTVFTGWR